MFAQFSRLPSLVAVLGLLIAPSLPASAQMSNRPFAFNTGGNGSVGMSIAGRQAILGQELFGATPDVLLRSPDGRLLIGPVRGPGRSAIVFSPSGESLPGFRRDFRNGRVGLSAGDFNAFFIPRPSDRRTGHIATATPASALVNTWTARILSDTGVGYGPPSAVSVWTGAVYTLDPRTVY